MLANWDQPSAECLAYWAKVRAEISKGITTPSRPPLSLAEQAEKQIARLKREIAEWEEIKAKGGEQ